jgi:hypothetical protein
MVQRWETRCCCFYGWWILALLVLSMCAAHSGSMLLNSLTIAEMMDEFAGEVRTKSTIPKARFGACLQCVVYSAECCSTPVPYVVRRVSAIVSSV